MLRRQRRRSLCRSVPDIAAGLYRLPTGAAPAAGAEPVHGRPGRHWFATKEALSSPTTAVVPRLGARPPPEAAIARRRASSALPATCAPNAGEVRFAPDFVCLTPGSGPPGRCPRSSGVEPPAGHLQVLSIRQHLDGENSCWSASTSERGKVYDQTHHRIGYRNDRVYAARASRVVLTARARLA